MLQALDEALPAPLKKVLLTARKTIPDWKQLRRQSFTKRYKKVFIFFHSCSDCGEPIAEPMSFCPWCGSGKNASKLHCFLAFLRPLPQGYAAGVELLSVVQRHRLHCPRTDRAYRLFPITAGAAIAGGKSLRFMKNCPWCHRKIKKKWLVWPFPEICGKCGSSVDSEFWSFCPWCRQFLL